MTTREQESRYLVSNEKEHTRFCGECSSVGVHVLPHIILLRKVEQLADLRSPLWTPHSRLLCISQAWQIILTCFRQQQQNVKSTFYFVRSPYSDYNNFKMHREIKFFFSKIRMNFKKFKCFRQHHISKWALELLPPLKTIKSIDIRKGRTIWSYPACI